MIAALQKCFGPRRRSRAAEGKKMPSVAVLKNRPVAVPKNRPADARKNQPAEQKKTLSVAEPRNPLGLLRTTAVRQKCFGLRRRRPFAPQQKIVWRQKYSELRPRRRPGRPRRTLVHQRCFAPRRKTHPGRQRRRRPGLLRRTLVR